MKKSLSALAFSLAGAFCCAPLAVFAAAGSAPAALALGKVDTVVGTGAAAADGSTITVHYTGWLYSPKADKQHGTQFDSSVGGQPFTFALGKGKVIPGWDQGLVGMKVGGKRTLIVPSSLGYGIKGRGPIPPGANLIFDIQLVSVKN
jgi:FKBP-type peptidyl-prolyl cis-trans isomerase FkpA